MTIEDWVCVLFLLIGVMIGTFAGVGLANTPGNVCEAHWTHVQPDTLAYLRAYPECGVPEDTP